MKLRRVTIQAAPGDAEIAAAVLETATGERSAIVAQKTAVLVSTYVPEARAMHAVAAVRRRLAIARRNGLLRSARLRQAAVPDRDWRESWKRRFRPQRIAPGVYLAASWARDFRPPNGAATIVIDPKMAFGTGLHATTRDALALALRRAAPGDRVIDVGCGSGILGIAVAQRGARVYACDNDPLAVAATRSNFRANGVRAQAVRLSDGPPGTFPKASLIVANIDAITLVGMARKLEAHLAPEGALVSSGVTKADRANVLAALAAAGLRKSGERKTGAWLSFVHRKGSRRA